MSLCLFFCVLIIAPATTFASTDTSKYSLQTIEPNAPIQVKVIVYHLNQYDSWVQPYIVTTRGNIGKWEITGYTYYKVGKKTGAEYYHDGGIITPLYTNYYGHKEFIRYISGWDYTGRIWTKPKGSTEPYKLYEVHVTYNKEHGPQTIIKNI